MIVSRSADYALRAMIYLARAGDTRYVTLKEIASEMGTPPFFLGRVMVRLVRSGVVLSLKGHHGGFRLGRPPSLITAGEVMRWIDGRPVVYDCSGVGACGLRKGCPLVSLFERAETAITGVLGTTTLESLSFPVGAGSRPLIRVSAARARKRRMTRRLSRTS